MFLLLIFKSPTTDGMHSLVFSFLLFYTSSSNHDLFTNSLDKWASFSSAVVFNAESHQQTYRSQFLGLQVRFYVLLFIVKNMFIFLNRIFFCISLHAIRCLVLILFSFHVLYRVWGLRFIWNWVNTICCYESRGHIMFIVIP